MKIWPLYFFGAERGKDRKIRPGLFRRPFLVCLFPFSLHLFASHFAPMLYFLTDIGQVLERFGRVRQKHFF